MRMTKKWLSGSGKATSTTVQRKTVSITEHLSVVQHLRYWKDVQVEEFQNPEGPAEAMGVDTHEDGPSEGSQFGVQNCRCVH